jgi:hypothetical protein
MSCSCETPNPAPIGRGTKVHHRNVTDYGTGQLVRTNGECPSWVQYISPHTAVVRYYSKSNKQLISEKAYSRSEFDETFEICPSQDPEPDWNPAG